MNNIEWLKEVQLLEDIKLPNAIVYSENSMTMPGLNLFLFEDCLPKAANEDHSAFEMKIMSEMFNRGISELGVLK